MGNLSTQFLSYVFLTLIVFYSSLARGQEVEDEREFDYVKGSGRGPEQWGELHEEWRACKNGNMQSPIDMLHERVEIFGGLGRLKRSYRPSNATIKNRGHDIMLEWANGGGFLLINGTKFELKQCHWHSPSEHTINGRRFDLEAHLVHESSDNKVAVVGIMYKIGRPDTFLSELMESIRSIVNTHDIEKSVGIVNPKHIKIGSRKYYRYMGSLTVPPCTEGVIWTMVKKVRTVSKEQVKLLREAVKDNAEMNARPLQPLNERDIHLYTPKFRPEDRY